MSTNLLNIMQYLYPAITSDLLNPVKEVTISSRIDENHKTILIGTHNGKFHCDEALATAMLKLLPNFRDAQIIRTRDESILEKCDIVVDVGAVYDVSRNRFDHHQRSFEGVLDGYQTKLSSAGLVYKHFGREVIRSILNPSIANDNTIELFYKKMYEEFIESVDAIDNGIAIAESPLRFKISTDLSSRVEMLNPSWNNSATSDENSNFRLAMLLTISEFVQKVQYFVDHWFSVRDIVQQAFIQRSSPEVLELTTYCPWVDHLFDLEKQFGQEGVVKYALYSDSNGRWRVHCVPIHPDSFETRLGLPSDWRGLRNEELDAVTGIPGGVFVHANGFIGGHNTREGALQLIYKSLELATKK